MSKKIKILVGVCVIAAISIILVLSIKTGKEKEAGNQITNLSFEYSDEDTDDSWNETDATSLTISDENNEIKIEKAGTYHLTGTTTNGTVIIDAGSEDTVRLILDNVDITCENSSPIYVKNAKKVIITLAENSVNTLIDGTEYVYDDTANEEPDGTLFSKDDLTINGSGTLNIKANFKDGIVSKDGLVITNGNINVEAADDGIRGKDYVAIKGGKIKITSVADAIKSTEDADTYKGYVLIDGGNIDITTTAPQTETSSSKGIKAITNIQVNAGDITIDSTDDGLHSNGNITINGGTFNIKTGDDGIHSDTSLYINDGEINITESYEGIESSLIEINGGKINIIASDDGINVAGGNDTSYMGGRGGRDNFTSASDSSQKLTVNNGEIYVNASGDGIDVNGAAYVNGGIVTVDGPTNSGNGALDYDSEFAVSNGTLIACGSVGMAQSISNSSTIYCLDITFNQTQSASSTIKITDEDGNTVLTYAPSKQYQSAIICSPNLKNGKQYTIYVDDVEIDTVTIENIVTNVGSMGMNNMMPNGGGQIPNENMQIPEGEISNGNMEVPGGQKPGRGH